MRLGRFSVDLLALALLLLLPLAIFAPVTLGSRTLVPADNLYQWAPWSTYAEDLGVTVPENELLSDLLLQNLAWKRFLLQSIGEREIPLWNPYLFSGAPFLATGQHSALYPFSAIFYLLPLSRAYGLFTVSQLFLAGAFMYLLMRVLRIGRPAAVLSGVVYQLCSYMLVSVNFPMVLAASAWLPFLLAMIELVVRQRPAFGGRPASLPWVLLGAVGLGMQVLAGHGENTYFTLLVMALYATWRIAHLGWAPRPEGVGSQPPTLDERVRACARPSLWLVAMVILGIGLGAVQFIPFVELVQLNFREGAASLADVLGWSYPPRRILTFLVPNFFGNPSHHGYLDLFTWQKEIVTANAYGEPILHVDWGIKNYVEGGAYLGVLPLLLAAVAILDSVRGRARAGVGGLRRVHTWFFALLSLASLSFVFPTGAYAILHALPVINQSHSPFRWVFPLTLSVAALAGGGMDLLARRARPKDASTSALGRGASAALSWLGAGTLVAGGFGAVALVLSRLFFAQVEPAVQQIFAGLAGAESAFPNTRAFFSYEWVQLMIAALMVCASGIILISARRWRSGQGPAAWRWLAILLVAFDLALATWGFNPAADPALLDFEPDLIRFLREQPGPWRLTTFTPHTNAPLHANTPWLAGLYDVRGYDSIIPRQYVAYMAAIEPQGELLYNRIQPIKQWESLNSPLLDLLNVRFIVTAESLPLPKLRLVWEGEGLRMYENMAAAPRAFTLPFSATVSDPRGSLVAMTEFDPRNYVIVEQDDPAAQDLAPAAGALAPAVILAYGSQEVLIDAEVVEPSWLVLADSYFPGWKAHLREAETDDETEVEISLVDGNFRGVRLPAGSWEVRFKYSPLSFKLGLFVTFMCAVVLVFMGGVWVWRYAYRESAADSAVRRVAKNSLAPMVLNLFNRAIDFAFAMLTLRLLGAENAGKYYVAINIAGWFEILANFGLHTLLMREVSKERAAGNRYLVNTTVLRTLTSVGAAAPIALYLLILSLGPNPIAQDTTLAIGLLIVAMIPSGVNTGLTALFYAHEKAEIPAAFSTVATFIKVCLGTLALLAGMGFVGLAAVSIVVSLVTMLALGGIAVRSLFAPRWELDWSLNRSMLRESFPLMLNHLLATLFFKVDVLLLERLGGRRLSSSGNTVVGWYSVAYKWVDTLNIIPSFFTMAVFPLMSRQAEESRDAMVRTYQLALKLLVMTALPLAVVTTCIARVLVQVLGGSEYLPHGALALQIMIWSIPFGWINSITNYVLIALGRQRLLTRAFLVGVTFNLVANLWLLPRYDYQSTAAVAILSELVLLVAFYVYLRPALGAIPWGQMLWRPLVAGGIMALAAWLGYQIHWVVGVTMGAITYSGAIALLRPFNPTEWKLLSGLFRRNIPESG